MKRNEQYIQFVTEMAKLSVNVPRIKPPKLLNYHQYIRSPFPDTRPGAADRHAIAMADIKRRTDFYYATTQSVKPRDLDELDWNEEGEESEIKLPEALGDGGGLASASRAQKEGDINFAVAEILKHQDLNASASKTAPDASVAPRDLNPAAATQNSPKSSQKDADTEKPELATVTDIPLPRVIMRHVLSPSHLLATNSPIGKITGFRIEVNGRRGTRAARQVVHYGKLATKDSHNALVDYGRSSFFNKKGSTGVRIWIGYGR
ncbi:hypothetical protein HDU97_003032 [Phlyctochytrium planicorne]|nr:hypothetical protein HDU97_003032 [Phlyctochytrium planicorne]